MILLNSYHGGFFFLLTIIFMSVPFLTSKVGS